MPEGQAGEPNALRLTRAELKAVILVCAVQFINMLDSMIVLPLGPEFSRALGIPPSQIGLIGGAFVLAACVSGLIGSLILDRFDRRRALAVCMVGLFTGTALSALSVDLGGLLASRVVAGLFGGPAGALAMAILADSVAVERRGRATGLAASSFALASVLGVPIGLQLAVWGGWQAPFLAVAALGLLIAASVFALLPPQRYHLGSEPTGVARAIRELLAIAARRDCQVAAIVMALSLGAPVLIPNLATYMTFNLDYPREDLGILWMAGGIGGLLGGNAFGRLSDRYGPEVVLWSGSVAAAAVIWLMFIYYAPGWPLIPVFGLFVCLNVGRNAVMAAVISRIPPTSERGRFNSLMLVASSGGMAAGAFLSSGVLSETPTGSLAHMDVLAFIAILVTFITPVLVSFLYRRILGREAASLTVSRAANADLRA